MKITIMGTGGLGGYIGGCLAHAGNDVTFIARGKQLDALSRNGLEVRSATGNFYMPSVKTSDAAAQLEPADLIVLSVKAYDLTEAIESMMPQVGPATMILPMLNGVEHMRSLNDRFGADRVLGGLSTMTAHVVAPGIVERIGEHGHLEFGEQAGGITTRVESIEKLLGVDGLNAKASPSILVSLWQKLSTICGLNVCCAIRGNKQAVLRGMPETGDLMRRLSSEVVEVAQAMNIDLQDTAIDAATQLFGSMPLQFKPSMLIALERGNRLELEALNGAVVRFGREFGVPTPANVFVYACLKPYVDGERS